MLLRRVIAAATIALAMVGCPDLQLVPAGGHGGATSSASSSASSSTASSTTSSSGTAASSGGAGGAGGGSVACVPPTVDGGAVGYLLLGDTAVESTTDQHQAGLGDASSFVALDSTTVDTITVWYEAGDAKQLLVGLYDDLGGIPNALLDSAVIHGPTPCAWNTGHLTAGVMLTAHATYWIALVAPPAAASTFTFRYAYEVGKGDSVHSDPLMPLTTMPSVWPLGDPSTDTFPDTHCSFYASH